MKTIYGEFKNYNEMREYVKQTHIERYKKLTHYFFDHSSMEVINEMTKQAKILVEQFGLTWSDVENLEIECCM